MAPDATDFDDDGGEAFSAVSFLWTPEDVKAAARYFVAPVLRPKATTDFGIFGIGFVGLVGVLRLAAPKLWDQIVLFMVVAVAVLFAFIGFSVLREKRREKARAMLDPRMMGNVVVRMDPYGVVLATDVSSEFISWFGVKRVEADGSGMFFRSGPQHGIYLPRRAFASDAAFDAFNAQVARFQANKKPPAHLGFASEPVADAPASIN